MFTLKDKVLIVTGAGSGMGRELTLQLIRKGVYIAACDINATTLAETASMVSVPELIKTYELDVANPEQVAALPRTVKQDFGRLHGVINNAGIIQPFVKFAELSPKTIDRVMNINFYGVVNLTRAVLQELDPDQDTHIVNISSMGGFLPVPGQAMYGASKAAVKLFTEALYGEVRGTNIHVSVVFPGAVATNISANLGNDVPGKVPAAKEGAQYKTTPADIAAGMIIEGIEKGKLKIFAGSDSRLMDRLYRLMPIKAIDMMAKRINKMIS